MKGIIFGYLISISVVASSASAQSRLPIEEALQLLFEDTNLEERISEITDRASNSIESTTYAVQVGDTLGGIVNMLYGNSSVLRRDAIIQALVIKNPRAFVRGNPNRLLAGATIERLEPEDLLNLIFNNYGEEISNFDTATAGWVRYSR
jgi:hypothetical protein